jgi:hypothetical protein
MTAYQSLADGNMATPGPRLGSHQGQDPVEHYFECISTCSLDDGACVTACVEVLRDNP